eukprot:TRINITY_DN14868_c0_g1_i2.p1 TRINITY_DN14868_c0_g1~~TRINITY_DN14868_c0_g1_i2.p1  ORF type:complete len:536 (+),score=67.78 TRINITY_DN14868_c0_g1_i2:322-1929(+)
MKGGGGTVPVLRQKRIILALIALVCTTFLVWGWERTPTVVVETQSRSIPLPGYLRRQRLGTQISETQTNDVTTLTLEPKSGDDESVSTPNEKFQVYPPPPESGSNEAKDTSFSDSRSMNVEHKPFDKSNGSQAESVSSNSDKDFRNGGTSPVPVTVSPSTEEQEQEDTTKNSTSIIATVDKTGCDYSEGKWVYDERRPLYSGTMCKRWLSGMWACRLTQRTDFAYEKYKWKPARCDMPEFKGYHFLSRMKDKTLAFIGDSLGRQQFQSMMCVITGGEDSPDVEDIGSKYGLVRAPHAIRPDGWAFRFPKTNTTVLYYWSASLCLIEPLNHDDPHTDYAMHLDRPASFLRDNLHRFDVVVLNTGHHWNRGKLNANRWRMYANGEPLTGRRALGIGKAHNLTVHSVVKWLDTQLPVYPKLRAFMRTISPRHFFNGDWDSGGRCDNTRTLSGMEQALQKRVTDPVSESAVRGTRVELLDITGISQLRDEAHLSKYSPTTKNGSQDCLHWCLPGVPDTWNELLFAQLLNPARKNTAEKA